MTILKALKDRIRSMGGETNATNIADAIKDLPQNTGEKFEEIEYYFNTNKVSFITGHISQMPENDALRSNWNTFWNYIIKKVIWSIDFSTMGPMLRSLLESEYFESAIVDPENNRTNITLKIYNDRGEYIYVSINYSPNKYSVEYFKPDGGHVNVGYNTSDDSMISPGLFVNGYIIEMLSGPKGKKYVSALNVKGADNKYYTIGVDANGQIVATELT